MVDASVNVRENTRTHSYRLRLKGRMHENDLQAIVLSEREVELVAGATTVIRLYREARP